MLQSLSIVKQMDSTEWKTKPVAHWTMFNIPEGERKHNLN